MAKLILPSGDTQDVQPAKGKKFTLKELQDLVGGYIRVWPFKHATHILLVDDDGGPKNLPPNSVASMMVQNQLNQKVVGNALWLAKDEMD